MFIAFPKIDTSCLNWVRIYLIVRVNLVRVDMSNWLIRHGFALCNEYRHRYGKDHACMAGLLEAEKIFNKMSGKNIDIYYNVTQFTRAMPDEWKHDNTIDTFEAYKRYIASKPWVKDNYLKIPKRKPDWI